MANPYESFCEDFYVNMRLGSQLPLPNSRETVLHFLESVQKQFPSMTRFRKNDAGELNLEEDRSGDAYRWACIEAKRLAAGHVNPGEIADALKLHQFLLELAPYHLGISPIEIDYLDLLLGFDLSFSGNHDDVIAEALLAGSPLACLAEEAGARPVDVQPSITVALSEDCRLQGRIDVVTRTNSYQVRTGDYSDEAISVYLIVRRYWGDRPKEPMAQILADMAERAEELCDRYVLPRIVKPLSQAISSRS
jgi:hypothetical protein